MSSIFGTTECKIELNNDWTAYRDNDKQSINASVPGNVQYDMFKAGMLPDPFVGNNCECWNDVCFSDYTYSLKFDASSQLISKDNVELVFEGIDTISIIKLNGIVIGSTDNMFKTWRFSVKEIIKETGNELKVFIKDPKESTLEIREKRKNSSEILKHAQKKFFGQEPTIQNYIRKMARVDYLSWI